MRPKSKKLIYIALAIANAVSAASWLILTAAGSSIASSQSTNYAAQRWNSEGGCSQISCFLSEDSGLNTDNITSLISELQTSLKNISVTPEEGKKLIPQACSTSAGQVTVRSDRSAGRSEAELTAIQGDFFLFRDFTLLDGSYFSDDDIMQDGAVIDKRLAWALYGSDKVAGMNLYINGIKFYISGVIDDPQTKYEKRTFGDTPRAYVSYKGTALLSMTDGDSYGFGGFDGGMDNASTGLKKVSCFECIVPDPVNNYAYNTVHDIFERSYGDKCTIVNNTTRFDPSVRAKAHKSLAEYAVIDKTVIYPCWENASRIAEFKLTSIYFYRRFAYIVPALTGVLLLIVLYRTAGKLRRAATDKTADTITKIIYNHRIRKETEADADKTEES